MAFCNFILLFFATTTMGALLTNTFSIQKDVCTNGEAPLADYFCGRGPNRQDCPSTHHCVVAPTDAYAVCCPNRSKREIQKSGVCPPRNGGVGICVAYCTDDSDCPGSQKCCGGCPRACVAAISA